MKLSQILQQINIKFNILVNQNLVESTQINDIVIDSRIAKLNDIFFPLKGIKNDGEKFVLDVVNKGVKVIAVNHQNSLNINQLIAINKEIIVISVNNNFELLVEFLKIRYQPLPKNIYGITGTNGKTSTVEFISQINRLLKKNSASIGTIGIKSNLAIENNLINSSLTTSDIVSLYRNLSILKKYQIDEVAIEVSSIGLHQNRIAGLEFACAGFTNISQDHLDYHQTMENYFNCKLLLFSKFINNQSFAIINSDIEQFPIIAKICDDRDIKIIDYGYQAKILKLTKVVDKNVTIEYQNNLYHFSVCFSGEFQIYNLLCALACILAKNQLNQSEIKNLLANFNQLNVAQGRMQSVYKLANNSEIFIDFAHSPDALKNVLIEAKKIRDQKDKNKLARVLVLFGCGGDRDAKKRPMMGEIACDLADLVIITDDNPRTEDPKKIRQQILENCDITKTIEIDDRRKAISQAIKMLKDNDVLILAGKGHEKYQIIGQEKFEFDEEKIVKHVIETLENNE